MRPIFSFIVPLIVRCNNIVKYLHNLVPQEPQGNMWTYQRKIKFYSRRGEDDLGRENNSAHPVPYQERAYQIVA